MSPLVSVEQLMRMLSDVTVLDVRHRMGGPPGREEYARGHVPGAVFVDLDAELAAAPGPGGRHPLPDAAAFEAAMRRAGVSDDRPVVVYDDWAGRAAARAWWLLRFHGHADVRVLDGAWPAWVRAGGPVETGSTGRPGGIGENSATGVDSAAGGDNASGAGVGRSFAAGDFTARPGGMPAVDAEGVPGIGVLVDARAPERYRGEVEPVDPVAGHVPGAVNVPTDRNLTADGLFRSAGELAAVYAEVGAVPGADVAAYCGSGVTAAHDVLALELAGVRAALYPGSWSEWVADPSRPVQTGPRKRGPEVAPRAPGSG